jgi:hypothetical protein
VPALYALVAEMIFDWKVGSNLWCGLFLMLRNQTSTESSRLPNIYEWHIVGECMRERKMYIKSSSYRQTRERDYVGGVTIH